MNPSVQDPQDNVTNPQGTSISDTPVVEVPQQVESVPAVAQGQVVAENTPKTRKPQFASLEIDGLTGDDSLIIGKPQQTSLSQFAVEKLKFQKGQQYLVCIPIDQVIAVRLHYEEKIGYYKCYNGSCCSFKPPVVRFIYPMSMYEINSDLQVVSKKLKHGAFVVGNDNHLAVQDLIRNRSITDGDFLIRCIDEKYQKLQIANSGTCIYQSVDSMVSQIEAFWGEHYKDITKSVFNVLTEEELQAKRRELAGSVDSGTQAMPKVNMESVFND